MKKRQCEYTSSMLSDYQKLLFLRQYLKDYQDISTRDLQNLMKFVWSSTLYNDFVRFIGSSSPNFRAQQFAKKPEYQIGYLNQIANAFNLFIYSPYKFLNGQSHEINLKQPFAKEVLKERLSESVLKISYGGLTPAQAQGVVDNAIESHLRISLKILFQLYTVQLSQYWLDMRQLQKLNNFIALKNIQTQMKQVGRQFDALISAQVFLVKATVAPDIFQTVLDRRPKKQKKRNYDMKEEPQQEVVKQKKEPKQKKTKQQIAKQKEQQAKKSFKALKDDEWYYNSRKLRNQQSQYQKYVNQKRALLERMAQFQPKTTTSSKKQPKIRIIGK